MFKIVINMQNKPNVQDFQLELHSALLNNFRFSTEVNYVSVPKGKKIQTMHIFIVQQYQLKISPILLRWVFWFFQ